jgi:UDP-2-acetamido-3-amino-2,3-dideoxy-glucuronate N-acetyltransferase
MTKDNSKLKMWYPEAKIADGADIEFGCRIDEGCEISGEAVIKPSVVLCQNVTIIGKVWLDWSVMIRENTILVGPLCIKQGTTIGPDAVIGATREDESIADKETFIHEHCRIGKQVEIIGGVSIGQHARVRAGSQVIGDVPNYGLVSHSPAYLERFACPKCGGFLRVRSVSQFVSDWQCQQCNHGSEGDLRFSKKMLASTPCHILLPNGALGKEVNIASDDQRWVDELEMR